MGVQGHRDPGRGRDRRGGNGRSPRGHRPPSRVLGVPHSVARRARLGRLRPQLFFSRVIYGQTFSVHPNTKTLGDVRGQVFTLYYLLTIFYIIIITVLNNNKNV